MKEKKENMLNVRLDEDTNRRLTEYSQQHDSSKSSIVKEALAMYFNNDVKSLLSIFTIDNFVHGKCMGAN